MLHKKSKREQIMDEIRFHYNLFIIRCEYIWYRVIRKEF